MAWMETIEVGEREESELIAGCNRKPSFWLLFRFFFRFDFISMCRLFVLCSHTRMNSSILWCCCCRCRCCLLSHSFSTESPIVRLAVGVFLSLFGFVFIFFCFGFVSFRRQMIPLWLCLYVHKLWYDNHYFKSSPINMKNIVIYLSTNAHTFMRSPIMCF